MDQNDLPLLKSTIAIGMLAIPTLLLSACGGQPDAVLDVDHEVAATGPDHAEPLWDVVEESAGWEDPLQAAQWETVTIDAPSGTDFHAPSADAQVQDSEQLPAIGPYLPPAPTATTPTLTASSCAFGAVQATVNKAVAGTTVRIPAGDCSWGTGQLVVPGGIHIRGAGKTATVIRRTAHVSNSVYLVKFDCANGQRARLSGLTLVGRGNSATRDKGVGLINNCLDFRVHHAKFTRFVFAAIEIKGKTSQRGVIYENDFIDNYSATLRNLGYGVVVYADATWPALELGTRNAVFVENNYMVGNRHHIASNNTSRYVFRYNTAVANDLTKNFPMVDAHGPAFGSSRGSRSWEVYNNSFSARLTSGRAYAGVAMRGGDGVIFGNTFTSNIAYPVVLTMEEGQCGTYPAQDQIRRAWIWNGGTNPITNKCPASIRLNRDYFNVRKSGYMPFAYPHPLRSQR